jgi:chaperone required for assembly of F1-ATPase
MTDIDKSGEQEKKAPAIPKDTLRPPLPKRFYKDVSVEPRGERCAVMLDGRPIRTPGKREFVVPTRDLAEALAAEWAAQGADIDPAAMPITRLVNTAIDAVEERKREVAEDIVAFAGSDLLCYRAEAPDALVRRQAEAWDPVLEWAKHELGAEFALRAGVMPIEQPAQSLEAVRRRIEGLDALSLAALHILTTITGSAVLALAHAHGELSADEAWVAATIDESWQREQWGRDEEAEAYAAHRRREFDAASRCLQLLPTRR